MKIAGRARLAAALQLLAVFGCAPEDPRIVATFQVGVEGFNFSSQVGRPGFYYAPPTLVGGYVYLGTSRRHSEPPADHNGFFKLDAGLKMVWEFPLGAGEVRGPAALDAAGNVYFAVETGRRADDWSSARDWLYSLTDDGDFRWRFEITGAPGTNDGMGMISPAIASDGTIYVGAGRLYALGADMAAKWEFTPPNAAYAMITNAPIIDPAGNLYFVAGSTLHSLRPDGTERWSAGLSWNGDGLSSPAFSAGYDRIHVASGATVLCLDAATGSTVWFATPESASWVEADFRATPAVDDVGNVYVGSKADWDSTFYAFSPAGVPLWERSIGADLYSSPALGDDRTIYVGSEIVDPSFRSHYGARFHALDMATGSERWSVELLGDVTWSSPALSDEGILYVGTMAGFVYAIRSDATGLLPGAGSPRFHEGNASTGRRE